MKILAKKLSAAGLILLFAGCYSFETAPIGGDRAPNIALHAAAGKAAEHVVVSNNGWFLFNLWPVACGNVNPNSWLPWRFFRNEVDAELLQNRLTRYAAERGCDIEEMNLFHDEQVLLSIPGASIPVPIPYVATYRKMQISAVLVKRPQLTPADAQRKQITDEMRKMLEAIPDGGAQ